MDYRSYYPAPLRWLSNIVDLILVLAGISIILLVFVNALLRGAAGFDLAWSLEVTAFLLLWSTFIGCSAAIARGAHMRVTEIVEHLFPVKSQRYLAILIDLITLVIMLSLIKVGYSISSHTWAQTTTVLYWPVGLLYASLPVGMLISVIFHSYNLIWDIRFKPLPESHHNDGSEDHP
ncbi:TRAP transporter small permease [Aestuariirhabdus sp. Z084]|uniref:TRAP transporter small permease n=1 Tax=Aestuariirhabdus haliotis TaxID=2918751 RepID=UPI00201B4511|nr:TRAP transporter small permease [Aestuariirhabdus haliotis]MCL6416503.1 TRAP transporter small permease [Aestuariirhabdus haliotis]MCL6420493.1 TRAP transporter small permease [Aestuariirhabdus haliotis]